MMTPRQIIAAVLAFTTVMVALTVGLILILL